MTRSSLRLWASSCVLLAFIACAQAEGGAPIGEGDGDGDGDNNASSGGHVLSSSGGVIIGATGGRSGGTGGSTMPPLGGASSTGGMVNLGGAGSGGTGAGTGGSFDGACEGLGDLSSVTATGDRKVYICPKVQSNCPPEAVNVPALFECVSTHVGNCLSQTPDGAPSWGFLGLCSETSMGGSEN